ncbi:MAG TPA: hypothetical protein VJR89_10670 [Polyangiales bacterium]|nr:hypothetical protein [Polyangiales bacterium]
MGTAEPASVEASTEGEASSAGPSSGGPAKPISAGLLLGYGISLEDANFWGFGFGLRGGYNIGAIFLGARFVYYLGEDNFNVWELGIEGGYDVPVAEKFVIRPQLGLGLATLVASIPDFTVMGVTVGGGSASSSEFYIAPGVSGLYDVTDSVFLGLDARFQLILADSTAKSIVLLANGGMRF